MRNSDSVSYTHLDVYKRQALARRIETGRFREPVPDLMAHETFGEEYQIVEAIHLSLIHISSIFHSLSDCVRTLVVTCRNNVQNTRHGAGG